MSYIGVIWLGNNREDFLLQAFSDKLQNIRPTGQAEKDFLSFLSFNPPHNMNYAHVLETKNSCFFGRAWTKETYHPIDSFALEQIDRYGPEQLIQRFWGSYVWISKNRKKDEVIIFRDPIGQTDFYYYRLPSGNIIFSSEINLIENLLPRYFNRDWDYLASFVTLGSTNSTNTPYQEVYELLPGYCLHISGDKISSQLVWHPEDNYRGNFSKFSKSELLAERTYRTIKAWTEPYENMVVSLSGGLDSSSILYALKACLKPHQKLTAFTHYHPSVAASNEIEYAQKVCDETGINLIKWNVEDCLPFTPSQIDHSLKPNKPSTTLLGMALHHGVLRQLKEFPSFVMVGGYGGDFLFFSVPPISSLADYILQKGWTGFKEKVSELSKFYRKPVLTLYKEALTHLAKHYLSFQKKIVPLEHGPAPSWFASDLIEASEKHRLSLRSKARLWSVPPGKAAHIESILAALDGLSAEGEAFQNPPYYYALLSQPLIEGALSIPSYDLYAGGYDRYPFRYAISKFFQTDTVWRKNKGINTGVLQLGLKKNLNTILELALEGEFSRRNLIDKDKIHQSIIKAASGHKETLHPLIRLLTAELYLRF